jgi:hypothetical protein
MGVCRHLTKLPNDLIADLQNMGDEQLGEIVRSGVDFHKLAKVTLAARTTRKLWNMVTIDLLLEPLKYCQDS